MNSECPVCSTENTREQVIAGGNEYLLSCQRCGEYILKFPPSDLPYILAGDIEKSVVLSHWIRTKYETLRKEPPDKQGGRKRPYLSGELVDSIIENPRPSLSEQGDSFIRWAGDNVKVGGQYIEVGKLAIQAIVGSATFDEFELVFRHLRDEKLIEYKSAVGKGESVFAEVTLSFSGWERYRELRRATSDSRKAFMAMQYGKEELDQIVESVFKPAVKQTGFDLFKLPDRPQPAGLIDDRIRVEIQTSRFLVADLTHANAGAYWEAGYAEGLGKPVIYTCEKRVFEEPKSKPHFDTNHHLTILWEWDQDKRKEAGEKLKSTIRATLPAEAKLTDD